MELFGAPNGLKFRFENGKNIYKLVGKVDTNDYKSIIQDSDCIILITDNDREIVPLAIEAKHLKPGDEFSCQVPLYLIPDKIDNGVISKVRAVDKGQFGRIYYINPHTKQ